jgi:hypothetical protein
MTTLCPSAARLVAVAAPTPLLPPVTMTLTRRSSSFPDRDAKDSCDSRTQVDGEALKRSKGINPADIRVCGYLDSPHK